MAQAAPVGQPKPPIPLNALMNSANAAQSFTPRKEFLRDHQQQVISSFALLSFAGAGFVRLYRFPSTVISGLRHVFDQNHLISSVREHAEKNFFEFTLSGKPWANHKTLDSERLIVSIFNNLMQHGYHFMSTMDYGREQDDRIAMAFAKPVSVPSIPSNVPSNVPAPNSSAVTVLQPGRAAFAISFLSPTLLHVISPPLHSTPAILQAVKGAWPRGLVDEKKVGDVFQFKFKGYKWFEEDTFAVDSLHQIFELFSRLDKNEFSLVTSLSFNNKSRSRTRDLWIFAGPSGEASAMDTPHSSPGGASLELTSQIPYAHLSNEKLSPVGAHRPINGPAVPFPLNGRYTHLRAAKDTAPATSSPLKPTDSSSGKGQANVLRKSPPRIPMPLAFSSDPPVPGQSPYLARHVNDQLTDSVGSLDMTGVGSGRGRADSQPRTPNVFYTTTGGDGTPRQEERNPYQNIGTVPLPNPSVPTLYPIQTGPAGPRARNTSLTAGGRESPAGPRPRVPSQTMMSSSTSNRGGTPENVSSPSSSGTAPSASRERKISSPAPASLTPFPPGALGTPPNGNTPPDENERPKLDIPLESVRSVTPPLLPSGVFRDSAFSSTTGWRSTELPSIWTGREFDISAEIRRIPLAGVEEMSERSEKSVAEEPRWVNERGPKIFQVQNAPLAEHKWFGAGPMPPGAWASTPKDERNQDDVATNMLPPTIQEHPSQEADDITHSQGQYRQQVPTVVRREGNGAVRTTPPAQQSTDDEEAARKSSKVQLETIPQKRPATARPPAQQRSAPRQERGPSGWVMVNIEGRQSGSSGQGKGRDDSGSRPHGGPRRSSMSPGRTTRSRPLMHQRSSSDTRAPRRRRSADRAEMAGMSSVSPAKAIAIMDAVGAREKSASGLGFMRIFSKSREKAVKVQSSSAVSPQNGRGQSPREDASKTRAAKYGTDESGRSGRKATPLATRSHNKRYSLN